MASSNLDLSIQIAGRALDYTDDHHDKAILHTTDGGKTWTDLHAIIQPREGDRISAVTPADPMDDTPDMRMPTANLYRMLE